MYQAKRPSVIARQKRQARIQFIKDIASAFVAVAVMYVLYWLAYFATL